MSETDNQRPDDLNPSQWNAVIHQKGHLLIIAGPGTGKTRTLIRRIEQTIPNLKVDQHILAVTFSNKAAQEMRQRIASRYSQIDGMLMVGTFHQFCLRLLREYIEETSLPKDFSLASFEEIEEMSKAWWPDKKPRERRDIMGNISQWKGSQFNSKDIPREVLFYNDKLREKALIDFDDLLLEALIVLKKHKEVLRKERIKFPYIFVDEYQDINGVQQDLLKLLVGRDNELTAIGDPNQAIYGFRGSNVSFFESFSHDFPGTRTLSLSENYRSAQNLVNASGQIMEKYMNVSVPILTAQIHARGQLIVYEAPTAKAEAEYVVHSIEKIIGGTSMFSHDSGRVAVDSDGEVSFGDIAVLYRLNSQRFVLQEAFERGGIPYQSSGSKGTKKKKGAIDAICPQRNEEVLIQGEKVSLMTMHAAKGLEFSIVFIVGCEEHILPLDLEGLSPDIQEERRLFYVGMTRAKHRLYLISAKKRYLYGKAYTNRPSPFLSDMEEELKEYDQTIRKKKRKEKEEKQLTLF